MSLDRRRFLALGTSAAAACALPSAAHAAAPAAPGNLRFVFFTDTHLQPELSADTGTALALAKIRSLKPDLCIQGGDHCFDLNAVPRDRSLMLLDSYTKTEHALDGIPIHHALGNHDIFGRSPQANIAAADPLYGKKAFEQHFDARTFYSFDRKGYHFIVLDSIALLPGGLFEGRIPAEQLTWLAADLAALAPGTPVIVTTHIPLVTAIGQYKSDLRVDDARHNAFMVANSFDALNLFEGHNVIAVLQGHTHINEVVWWRNVPYITSGAVSGNWWKGSRWGTPEGFTVVDLAGGRAQWHYETYGWKSVAPEPDSLPILRDPRVR